MTEEKKEETKQEEVKEEKTVFQPSSLVGLVLSAAEELAKRSNWKTRVVEKDGKSFLVTQDIRSDRVGLYVMDGKVSKVEIG